jgi:hypothetical protein
MGCRLGAILTTVDAYLSRHILIAAKNKKEEGNLHWSCSASRRDRDPTLAGDVDFFTNAGSALAAAVRGIPVKLVTVFQDKPGWDLIAQPDIKSIAQLRGKNIAIMSPEGSLAVVAREILRKNGLDPAKDVNLVVMGGDSVRFPALQTKAIHATLFNTGMSVRAQGRLYQVGERERVRQPDRGWFATSSDKIKQNPENIPLVRRDKG